MTVYTTLPTDDENLEVTVTDDPSLVTINITPAQVSGGGSGTVTNVATGTGLTGGPITTSGTIAIDTTADITFNTVTATDEFIGHLDGSVRFTGKNRSGSTIEPGQVVYISGLSGNTPEVELAKSNSASTMPAFGISIQTIADNNNGQFATFGSQTGLDIADWGESGITFAEGDILYVSATEAGKLTNVLPTGETNQIQNIGMLERATPTTNTTIKVGGAGRSNDTPNLDNGNIFIGDSNNNAITNSLDTAVSALGYIKSETDAQTLSFSTPNLTISNGNSVDLTTLKTTSLPFSSITSTPTTIAGYGISDAFDGAFSSLSGKPTTIAGYGITDALELGTTSTTALAGDTTFAFADITSKPTTVSGYGITDAATLTGTETLTNKTLTQPYVNEIKYMGNSGSAFNFQSLKISSEFDPSLNTRLEWKQWYIPNIKLQRFRKQFLKQI